MSTVPAPSPRRKPGPDGAGTRQRLISAALDLFGRKGFDGVGAREIAAAAGAPLAAIPYHFGTKDVLYRAALEQVRARLGAGFGPAAALAGEALDGSPDDAARAVTRLQGALLDVIAGDPEAATWAKLLLREHLDPSATFDLVYEDAAKDAIDLIALLLAKANGGDPADPRFVIAAFAKIGEVLVFRLTQHALTRRLGWGEVGADERSMIRNALGWR